MLRLLWRWTNALPALPADMPRWENLAARASHIGLYLLMLASTLTGWALAGTFRTPLNKDVFNLTVPSIYTSQDRAMHGLFEQSHELLSYALAILVVVHLVAALRHHFWLRDTVLTRIITPSSDRDAE